MPRAATIDGNSPCQDGREQHDVVEKGPSCVGNLEGIVIVPRKRPNGGSLLL